MTFRSLLFVPGARPDRFEKAMAANADAVCIDLEDAVAPDLKADARREAHAFLKKRPQGAAVGLRINALSTLDGFRDCLALAESGARPAFVMMPKVSGPFEIEQLREVVGIEAPIWPLMETADALFVLPQIARAVGESGGILFGGVDYAAALGSDLSFDALHAARAAIVAAAATVGAGTMDVPFLDVKDEAGLRAETERVKAMGFQGRAAIHPAQIPVINAVFTPTPAELAKAERIAAAFAAAASGIALLDGKLIEKPVLKAAERVLAAKGKP
jgi:citrate lyase subunit beta/citryl-CoA lyase/(S)-citramalyl-CoA lyase